MRRLSKGAGQRGAVSCQPSAISIRPVSLVVVAAVALLVSSACTDRRGTYVVGAAGSTGYGPFDGGSFDRGNPGPVDASYDVPPFDGAAANAHCIDACDAAQNVGCASDSMQDCINSCQDTIQRFPMCAALWDAYNTCAALAPKSAWRCDVDGFAKLSSACTSENNAAQTCFYAH